MTDDTLNPLDIPYGYCRCGCGQETDFYSRGQKRKPYIHGHWATTIKQPTPIEVRGDFALLHMARGKTALIDVGDIHLVTGFCWQIQKTDNGYYVFRHPLYLERPISAKDIYLHRLLMQPGVGEVVDHWNRNPLDNRRANLRVCTVQENVMKGVVKRGVSGFRGVHWHERDQVWEVSMFHKRKRYYGGRSTSPQEAALMADRLAIRLRGEFAMDLNFPDASLSGPLAGCRIWVSESDLRKEGDRL